MLASAQALTTKVEGELDAVEFEVNLLTGCSYVHMVCVICVQYK